MTIVEAARFAGMNGQIVRMSSADQDGDYYYEITDKNSRISMFAGGEKISILWEPQYSDLVADDWVVLKKGIQNKWNS